MNKTMKALKENLWRRIEDAAKPPPRRRRERGMTLVEIMVVVVIISLVTGVVGVAVFGRLKDAQIQTTQTQIKAIADALDHYKLSFRKYPSTAEGLSVLAAPKGKQEPFMNQIPKDAWDNSFVYIFPGSHNSGSFDLLSYGPDGSSGGSDDIGNWSQPGE